MPRIRIALLVLALLPACPDGCLHQELPPPTQVAPYQPMPQAQQPQGMPTQGPQVPRPSAPAASKTKPTVTHPAKGTFGDQIELVGWDAEPLPARAGAPLQLTFYFHALKDVTNDWEVFLHFDDHGGKQVRVNGDHYPADGTLRTDQWKAGDYITDRFSIDVPPGETGAQMDLWMGFYRGDDRLPISNPGDCTNDGNNRLLAGTVQISP